jgi:hypothetical protein
MKSSYLTGAALAAMLVAGPGIAFAATGSGNGNANNGTTNTAAYAETGNGGYNGTETPIPSNNGNNNGHNNSANSRPSQRNPLLSDNGDVRASKLIGTNVYNDKNQQLGSVQDVLVGRNGVWAVISDNNKQVAVPFKELQFGDSNANGHDKAVLPNMTQAELNQRPAYYFNETNYANNNNGHNANGGGFFANNNGVNNTGGSGNANGNGTGVFGNGGNAGNHTATAGNGGGVNNR